MASGVGVLDKAVSILEALRAGPLTLAGLVAETGLSRATAHRLAQALCAHGLVERDPDGAFRLGQRLASLGTSVPTGSSIAQAAQPALRALRDATGESTQLYVPAGGGRLCVASLESPYSLRTIVAVGEVLPMDRGSAGAVLSGRGEASGRGFVESVEERERGVASVSAPVTRQGRVVAAVSVSGPIDRTTRAPGRRYGEAVAEAAREVEIACGFDREGSEAGAASSFS